MECLKSAMVSSMKVIVRNANKVLSAMLNLRVFNYMMKVKMAHASRKIAMAGSTSCSYPPT